jgi:hypothetical protein
MTDSDSEKQSYVNNVMDYLKKSSEILGLLVAVGTSIAWIVTHISKENSLNKSLVLITVDFLNLLILLIALTVIKPSSLKIKTQERRKLKESLNLQVTSVTQIEERVDQLVEQLVYCIKRFAAILAIFYLLQLISDVFQFINPNWLPSYKSIKPDFLVTHNIFELVKNKSEAASYLSYEFLTNSTNLFSAAYLFLAFQVLFIVTLTPDGRDWRFRGEIPFGIAILITVLNIALMVINIGGLNLLITSHAIKLIGGVYNGLAMLLLFSRFIAMEYFFKNSANIWRRRFYLYGTVIVLPLYVIAQPLYGVFNAVEFGGEDSPELFKSLVFLVCFWGKLVFLLFIFNMLRNKWIHSYLFLLLSQKDHLSIIAAEIEDVEDLELQES